MEEKALSLKEVAEKLGVSYRTVFDRRSELGFRIPGSRIWRVWPSTLADLSKPRNNVTRISLRVKGDKQCHSLNDPTPAFGGLLSQRQAAKELDALLAQPTRRQHKSCTIG